MKPPRLAALALLAIVVGASTGCRTAGLGTLGRHDTPLPRATASPAELLAAHNRNALKVETLVAMPTVNGGSLRGRMLPGASSKLALARPRDFRFEVEAAATKVADIGSNDTEYWYWFKDSPAKAVYFSNYDDAPVGVQAVGLQPDWIVDAMGLRPVTEEEIAATKVAPGRSSGTLTLTQRVEAASGGWLYKEIILDESTRRIVQQNVYAQDHKTLLARAAIRGFEEVDLPAEPGEPTEKVYCPARLTLELPQEKVSLSVVMGNVKVNEPIDQRRSAFLSPEPKLEGFDRVNIAELTPPAARRPQGRERERDRDRRAVVRETMPAPPPRVRLNDPSPLGSRRSTLSPPALASIPPEPAPANARGVEEVVGPPIPTVADPAPDFVQANTGWRGGIGALER